MATRKCLKCSDKLLIKNLVSKDTIEKIKNQEQIAKIAHKALKYNNSEICPFCKMYFCIVDGNTRNLVCEKCHKIWCRKCKSDGHEWGCNQIRDPTDENISVQIAKVIDNALIRKCPYCNTTYIKDYGCTLVKCTICGGKSCYLCGIKVPKKIIDGRESEYWHYRQSSCKVYLDGDGETEDQGNEKYNKQRIINACREFMNENSPKVKEKIILILKDKYQIRI
jgi:hypothetical protein